MTNLAVNNTVCAVLTNKSGGLRSFGDVVVMDGANANSFNIPASNNIYSGGVGVVIEPNGIAADAAGAIALAGYVPQVNLQVAGTAGQFIATYSSGGKGYSHDAPINQGDFALQLSPGPTISPAAYLFSRPNPYPALGLGDKWTEVVKTLDQDVTTNTLQNDNELVANMPAGVYQIQLFIMYSGASATNDYKCDFGNVGAVLQMEGSYRYVGDTSTSDSINVSTGIKVSGTSITPIQCGTDASHGIKHMYIEALMSFPAGCTFKYRFCLNVNTGTVARTKRGSILRYRNLLLY